MHWEKAPSSKCLFRTGVYFTSATFFLPMSPPGHPVVLYTNFVPLGKSNERGESGGQEEGWAGNLRCCGLEGTPGPQNRRTAGPQATRPQDRRTKQKTAPAWWIGQDRIPTRLQLPAHQRRGYGGLDVPACLHTKGTYNVSADESIRG